jgi:hypothetical protein
MAQVKTRKSPFRLAFSAFHPGQLPVDALLDRARGRGDRLFHRPYSSAEARGHPDGDRIIATVEGAVHEALAIQEELIHGR